MGSQRVGHAWVTEQQQILIRLCLHTIANTGVFLIFFFFYEIIVNITRHLTISTCPNLHISTESLNILYWAQSHISLCVGAQSLSCVRLWLHGLPTCPWDFPGKDTVTGCHILPGDLPDTRVKLTSPLSPSMAGEFFTTEPPGDPTFEEEILISCLPNHSTGLQMRLFNFHTVIVCFPMSNPLHRKSTENRYYISFTWYVSIADHSKWRIIKAYIYGTKIWKYIYGTKITINNYNNYF